jgi:hypothetical protein
MISDRCFGRVHTSFFFLSHISLLLAGAFELGSQMPFDDLYWLVYWLHCDGV